MTDEVLVEADNVGKKYCRRLKRSLFYGVEDIARDIAGIDGERKGLRKHEFWANDGISFQVRRGECLGLVGRNGAGKTTLLKMINGLVRPDRGRITVRGRVGALIALGAGFNPILTGRENVRINGTVLGLSKREVEAKMDDIVEFSEIGDFIDAPLHSYSSGMVVRLGFSVATALDPDVLILDEVLAVGDIAFHSKCYRRIGEILPKTAVIFVSHQLGNVARICNRCMVLGDGRVQKEGPTEDALGYFVDSMVPRKVDPTLRISRPIRDAAIISATEWLDWAGQFEMLFEIESEVAVRPYLFDLNIRQNQTTIAYSDLRAELDTIPAGRVRARLVVAPVHLQRGKYSCTVFMTDETGKRSLIHGIDAHGFEVRGGRVGKPAHRLPAQVSLQEQGGARPDRQMERG